MPKLRMSYSCIKIQLEQANVRTGTAKCQFDLREFRFRNLVYSKCQSQTVKNIKTVNDKVVQLYLLIKGMFRTGFKYVCSLWYTVLAFGHLPHLLCISTK